MVSAASGDGPGQLRRAVSLSDDPLGPLGGDSDKGGDAGPSTLGPSVGRLQPGYFDLTRRTAEGVERAQAATSPSVRLPKLSPRMQDDSTTSLGIGSSSIRSSKGSRSDDLLSVTTTESGTSPSRRSHSSSRDRSRSDAEAEQREGTTTPTEDDEVGALSTPRLRRNTTVRSRNRARVVSMIMLDGGADPEDTGAADEGEAAIAQEPSPSLLQSFHRMTDAELIKHSGKEMPAALSLLRAASRALYEAREEVLTLEHDLASTRAAQEEERSTSQRREKALMQLCKEYGRGTASSSAAWRASPSRRRSGRSSPSSKSSSALRCRRRWTTLSGMGLWRRTSRATRSSARSSSTTLVASGREGQSRSHQERVAVRLRPATQARNRRSAPKRIASRGDGLARTRSRVAQWHRSLRAVAKQRARASPTGRAV